LSHESKLTCDVDIKFHFSGLVSYIIKFTKRSCVWCPSQNLDRIIHHHLGHMRSDEISFHVCLLDSRHSSYAEIICVEICGIPFCRIGRSCNRT
jgi:hypothetical protein